MTGAPALTVDTRSIRSALPAPAAARQESPDTFQEALKRSAARNAQVKRPGASTGRDSQASVPTIFHTASDLAAVELATPAQAKLSVAKAESGQTAPAASRKNEQRPSHQPVEAPQADGNSEKPDPTSAPRSSTPGSADHDEPQSGAGSSGRAQSGATAATSGAEPAELAGHAERRGTSSGQRDQPGAGASQTPHVTPASPASTRGALGSSPQVEAAAAAAPAGISTPASPGSGPSADPRAGAAVGAIKPAGALQSADAARAAKPAPAAQDTQQERLQAQFGKGLAAALRQNGGTVTLRLKPEDLGDLKIRLNVQNGRVEARFEVSTDEAQAAVGDSLKHLRSALEAKGLEVTRLDVHTVERRDPASPGRDAPDSGPGFANQDHGAAGGESGGHGRPGAESDRFGPARDLASGAAAEPQQERSPLPAWMSRRSEGISGGAPHNEPGLDAIA